MIAASESSLQKRILHWLKRFFKLCNQGKQKRLCPQIHILNSTPKLILR